LNIQVLGIEHAAPEFFRIECVDSTGREIKLPTP